MMLRKKHVSQLGTEVLMVWKQFPDWNKEVVGVQQVFCGQEGTQSMKRGVSIYLFIFQFIKHSMQANDNTASVNQVLVERNRNLLGRCMWFECFPPNPRTLIKQNKSSYSKKIKVPIQRKCIVFKFLYV